ncbi:MAG: VCBS repeat-containing protein, partial [Pyrinomonadaceae bacterium]|nr:VCBS repeat-containing protein [Pyrinomonadaceae bacterium]
KVDLAIRRITSTAGVPNFTILPGNGAGGFGTPFELTLALAGQFTYSRQLAVIDANLDGKADILISRQGGFFLYNGSSALFTRTENDFDGDLRTDLSVYRPSIGTWFINRSTNGITAQQFGIASDKPAAADYDGDGRTDLAVWRESASAFFHIFQSSTNTYRFEQFGQTGDVLTVNDWDGDGKADASVYRDSAIGSQSYFFYRGTLNNPNGTITFVPWGTVGDKAARGDFDGDGKADAAIFRPSNGVWFILQSSNNQGRAQQFGTAADRRVPADYDGDGKTDIAIVRPANNDWYILNSATGTAAYRQWGANSDALIPGDYNGDGRTEISTYRAAEGNWYIPQCADFRQAVTKFGATGDVAVPSTLLP